MHTDHIIQFVPPLVCGRGVSVALFGRLTLRGQLGGCLVTALFRVAPGAGEERPCGGQAALTEGEELLDATSSDFSSPDMILRWLAEHRGISAVLLHGMSEESLDILLSRIRGVWGVWGPVPI